MTDLSLLEDFITETNEHLEEMESNLLLLETAPGNRDLLNDIFRSTHTIKGASEYMGMERIAELSHRLENLLENLRHGDQTPTQEIVDLLIDSKDRMTALVHDIEQTQNEAAETGDLLRRLDDLAVVRRQSPEAEPPSLPEEDLFSGEEIIPAPEAAEAAPPAASEFGPPADESGMEMEEEYDEELFEIFIQHLEENLEKIVGLINASENGVMSPEAVDDCVTLIEGLHSSANYMDYEKIARLYETWQTKIEAGTPPDSPSDGGFLAGPDGDDFDFLSGMKAYVQRLIDFFPKLKSVIPADEASLQSPDEGLFSEDRDLAAASSYGLTESSEALFPDEPPADELPPEETAATEEDSPDDAPAFEANYQGFYNELDSLFTGSVTPVPSASDIIEETAAPSEPPEPVIELETEAKAEKEEEPLFKSGFRPLTPETEDEAEKRTPGPETAPPETLAAEVSPEEQADAPPEAPAPDTPEQESPEPSPASLVERSVKQSIRVDARKIDSLMNQVGELVVSRAWFSQLYSEMQELQGYLKDEVGLNQRDMKPVKALSFRISEAIVALGRVANELQEGVMKVRMLPIAQLFNRYPRLVRDLIHDIDKRIRLEVIGEETELDKMVIEEISDPLIHLIRNAVDHGCETVSERRNAGKPEECLLRLQSYHESNHVVIEISDDGRGIDLERIRRTALTKKISSPEEIERMTHRELMGLIMKPGFSTAANVSRVSGRGVGMDVVKQNVEKLNGTIEIDSRINEGTRFRIKIPLTLAIIQALLVRAGHEIFTVPLTAVEETLRVYLNEITTIEGVECIYLRNSTLSLLRLSEIFSIPSESDDPEKAFVVVVNTGMRRVGLVVDALIGQEETVIKPLVDYLQEKSGFSGATILGDGRISLILDVYELVNLSFSQHAKMKELSGMGKEAEASFHLDSPHSQPGSGMLH